MPRRLICEDVISGFLANREPQKETRRREENVFLWILARSLGLAVSLTASSKVVSSIGLFLFLQEDFAAKLLYSPLWFSHMCTLANRPSSKYLLKPLEGCWDPGWYSLPRKNPKESFVGTCLWHHMLVLCSVCPSRLLHFTLYYSNSSCPPTFSEQLYTLGHG